jgi:tetratricopeptide (TPR) repeat protein
MMSILRVVVVAVLIAGLLGIGDCLACTMVMVAKGEVVLAGNNEDWQNPSTWMWFVPAKNGEHGRVCFGFDDGFTQGGMNDQGLFIDANALSPTGWQADPDKPIFRGNLMDHILAHCATVEEAADFFRSNSFPSLTRAKFPLADARGEAAVVEWGQGKLQILKRRGRYQISTNFVQSEAKPGDYPCDRYRMADQILGSRNEASVDLVRRVLSATHSELFYPTLYSNIFDLKARVVYLYNFHDFEEAVVIDLSQELRKGARKVAIPSLFTVKTQAAHLFDRYRPKSGSTELLSVIRQENVAAAIKKFHLWKNEFRKLYKVDVSEDEINTLGYLLLHDEQISDAIEIFKLNVNEHPTSANTFDSLGEAYMLNGDTELAIANYRRSLELNPENQNAREQLKKLDEGH